MNSSNYMLLHSLCYSHLNLVYDVHSIALPCLLIKLWILKLDFSSKQPVSWEHSSRTEFCCYCYRVCYRPQKMRKVQIERVASKMHFLLFFSIVLFSVFLKESRVSRRASRKEARVLIWKVNIWFPTWAKRPERNQSSLQKLVGELNRTRKSQVLYSLCLHVE